MDNDIFELDLAQELPSDEEILDLVINSGEGVAAKLTRKDPATKVHRASEDPFKPSLVNATHVNNFFHHFIRDLGRLYSGANYSDKLISSLENSGNNELSIYSQQLDVIEDMISANADLQILYNKGYTAYLRANLINNKHIEHDLSILGNIPAKYNQRSQAIELQNVSSSDVLHTKSGDSIVDVGIDFQIGYPLNYFSSLRTPNHAIDKGGNSYWSELVLTDSPLENIWPGPESVYLPAATGSTMPFVYSGAVSEYAITFQSPSDFNYVVVKPYSEMPINLAAIFVIKHTTTSPMAGEYLIGQVDQDFSIYYISEYDTQRDNGYLFLDQTSYLRFHTQQGVKKLVLVFHQPHYTKEIFSLTSKQIQYNAIWQYMLGNGDNPIPGVNLTYDFNHYKKILRDTSTVLTNLSVNKLHKGHDVEMVKYQYLYGAYNIEVHNKSYVQTGVAMSKQFSTSINLIQGAIVADYNLPMETTTIAAGSAWIGPNKFQPDTYAAPSSTIDFDLAYGNTLNWTPVAPIGATTVFENMILAPTDDPVNEIVFRLQIRPGTLIYITSFDGFGGAELIGALPAPPIVGSYPTVLDIPNVFLQSPGFYVFEYTPIDTSFGVNFIDVSSPVIPTYQTIETIKSGPNGPEFLIDRMTGTELKTDPFIDSSKIIAGFEPNGNPNKEYVPISIEIDDLDLNYFDPVLKVYTVYKNIHQDRKHGANLFASFPVALEQISTKGQPQNVSWIFTSKYPDWDTSDTHYPQLFQPGSDGQLDVIPQTDPVSGLAVWTFDPVLGEITFVNGTSGFPGQLFLSYWYFDTTKYAKPRLMNMTSYAQDSQTVPQDVFTKFDLQTFPIVQYAQIGPKIYFNRNIPSTAKVKITYNRLYDAMRMRATLTRVDPANEASTPQITGFTLAAKDANSTSSNRRENIATSWPDIQYYSLGPTTQVNPGGNQISNPSLPGGATPGGNFGLIQSPNPNSLPSYIQLNWYEVVNCGSDVDYLRTAYPTGTGTIVYIDLTNSQYITPDAGLTDGTNYFIMNSDGSNNFEIDPGQSIYMAIGNIYGQNIDPATVYDYCTKNYLDNFHWLYLAPPPDQDHCAIRFTIE